MARLRHRGRSRRRKSRTKRRRHIDGGKPVLKEMGPEFNELWDRYFKDKHDKPVMFGSIVSGAYADQSLLPPGQYITLFQYVWMLRESLRQTVLSQHVGMLRESRGQIVLRREREAILRTRRYYFATPQILLLMPSAVWVAIINTGQS